MTSYTIDVFDKQVPAPSPVSPDEPSGEDPSSESVAPPEEDKDPAGNNKQPHTELQDTTLTDSIPSLSTKLSVETWSPSGSLQRALVANKATGALHVYEYRNDTWRFVTRYGIATGKNDGKKLSPGDRKTPEGLYFIIGLRRPPDLLPKYGPLAYEINFPNSRDRLIDRSGSGIWIHGTEDGGKPDGTLGCIAMKNRDLQDLHDKLGAGIGTPLVIVDLFFVQKPDALLDPSYLTQQRMRILAEYRENQGEFAELIDRWRNAWVDQDIGTYSSFYDTDSFFGQGLYWEGWKERKARTFDNYSFIEITIEDLILTSLSDSLAAVEFVQTYSSDVVTIKDWKAIQLTKTNDSWKINREESFPIKERAL